MNYYDITVKNVRSFIIGQIPALLVKFIFCVTIFIASKINYPRCDQIIVFFLFSKPNVAAWCKVI